MRRTAVDPDTRHARRRHLHAEPRRRRRAAAALMLLVVLAVALPATTTALGGRADAAAGDERSGTGTGTDVRELPAVDDEEAWCAYFTSHYVSFPAPWTARVINCRDGDLFVAPVHADGSHGPCVLVPARHSRHLGGSIARWVTDTRLC